MAKVITTELQHSGASGANITLDSSKNVTCENNLQVDGNVTVTGTLPADKLTGALPAISGASLTGVTDTLSFRNIVTNGAMQINQRGDKTGITSAQFGGPDRWKTNVGSCGTWSISKSTDSPDGFGNSLKWDCTTADASPAAGDVCFIESRYEGQDLQHLEWGTSGAKSLTLSFWIKCNKTGNIAVCFWQLNSQRMITKTATISSANTWEKKTITIPGDTGGSGFTNDNAGRFQLEFWFDGGSNFQGGSNADRWGAEAANRRGNGETLALADSTSNALYITGIQMEVGSTATDYEHRSYGDELARCQRYYYRHVDGTNQPVGIGQQYSGTNCSCNIDFPVSMRTSSPAIDATSGGDYYYIYGNGNSSGIDGALSLWMKSENAGFVEGTNDSDIGGGLGTRWISNNAAAYIAFNAET